MAEFVEVMKQAKRMCEAQENCEKCQVFAECGGTGRIFVDTDGPEVIERIVMDWAAAHPEPRYPSWKEAWRQLFPAAKCIPCPTNHFGADLKCERNCVECANRPMTADVAEKLGIKPIGGANDENA